MRRPDNPMYFALLGGDIPEAAEERRKEVATDVTTLHSHGINAGDRLEPETRGALESGMGDTGRTKRKEQERDIYVQLSDDHSDPEHMARKHRLVYRSPSTLEHNDKVNFISNRNVQVYECGSF